MPGSSTAGGAALRRPVRVPAPATACCAPLHDLDRDRGQAESQQHDRHGQQRHATELDQRQQRASGLTEGHRPPGKSTERDDRLQPFLRRPQQREPHRPAGQPAHHDGEQAEHARKQRAHGQHQPGHAPTRLLIHGSNGSRTPIRTGIRSPGHPPVSWRDGSAPKPAARRRGRRPTTSSSAGSWRTAAVRPPRRPPARERGTSAAPPARATAAAAGSRAAVARPARWPRRGRCGQPACPSRARPRRFVLAPVLFAGGLGCLGRSSAIDDGTPMHGLAATRQGVGRAQPRQRRHPGTWIGRPALDAVARRRGHPGRPASHTA